MKPSKFKNPLILGHIAGLVLAIPLTVFLAFTYSFAELAPYKFATMTVFIALYIITNVLAALALRRIGQSPFLALTGFVMGLIPLILYAVLPDKSSPAA